MCELSMYNIVVLLLALHMSDTSKGGTSHHCTLLHLNQGTHMRQLMNIFLWGAQHT